MEERRQYSFRVRPNYGEVLGYIDEGPPWPLTRLLRSETPPLPQLWFLMRRQLQTQAAIDAAVGAVDLSGYYTSARTDAAITSALVPVTLSNAPAWTGNPPTWELLKGSNVIRNLHFAGPLSASLQNNTDTLEIDCDSYEKAETFTQAEVNSVVSGAVDALNIAQYRTESQVNQAITDALVPYATDADVSAATAGLMTQAQGDARYFATSASLGGASIVRSNMTPPQIRAMTAVSGSPLSISAILSGTILELGCNAYTKRESDTRYLRTGTYTTTLDPRYLAQNATPGNAEVFTIIRDANAAPRQLRGILPRAPLSWQNILSGTVTELLCDAYSKSESDATPESRHHSGKLFRRSSLGGRWSGQFASRALDEKQAAALEGNLARHP